MLMMVVMMMMMVVMMTLVFVLSIDEFKGLVSNNYICGLFVLQRVANNKKSAERNKMCSSSYGFSVRTDQATAAPLFCVTDHHNMWALYIEVLCATLRDVSPAPFAVGCACRRLTCRPKGSCRKYSALHRHARSQLDCLFQARHLVPVTVRIAGSFP